MAQLQNFDMKDAVWLFNYSNGQRQLAERGPAELVEEGYLRFTDCLLKEDIELELDDSDEEECISDDYNPYEVVELTVEDVTALDSCEEELYHAGTTTPDELPEMDSEFRAVLLSSLDDYDVSEEKKDEMEEQIERSTLFELMELFSKNTDTVKFSFAFEEVIDGCWGATLHYTRTKEEALALWIIWLERTDWFSLVV